MLKNLTRSSFILHTKRLPLTLCTQLYIKPYKRLYSIEQKIEEDFPQQTKQRINIPTKQPQTEEEKYAVYNSHIN